MLPSPDILNDFEYGKFVLSNLAAKRAKQLREGAPPLVQIDSHHPLTIALAEIAAGRIKPVLGPAELAMEEVREIQLISDEPLPAELGMLLPALDETEAAMVGAVVLAEDDHEHDDHDHDHDESLPVSLTDLVEEEEEVVAPVADDDTLSLSDIAEQETSLEEEEAEE
jgi:DNA-directed RNA polymerase subunit omega